MVLLILISALALSLAACGGDRVQAEEIPPAEGLALLEASPDAPTPRLRDEFSSVLASVDAQCSEDALALAGQTNYFHDELLDSVGSDLSYLAILRTFESVIPAEGWDGPCSELWAMLILAAREDGLERGGHGLKVLLEDISNLTSQQLEEFEGRPDAVAQADDVPPLRRPDDRQLFAQTAAAEADCAPDAFAQAQKLTRSLNLLNERPSLAASRVACTDLTGDDMADLLVMLTDTEAVDTPTPAYAVFRGSGDHYELVRERDARGVIILDSDLVELSTLYDPGDAKCCPSGTRYDRFRWTSSGFSIIDTWETRHEEEEIGPLTPSSARRIDFQSPTGNIRCQIDPADILPYAACMTLNNDVEVSLGRTGPAGVSSGVFYQYVDATPLPYGDFVVAFNPDERPMFECSSAADGVTCSSSESGHGFHINRDGVSKF